MPRRHGHRRKRHRIFVGCEGESEFGYSAFIGHLDQEQTVRQVFGEIERTGATGLLAVDLTATGDDPEAIASGTTEEIKAALPAGTKTQEIRPDNIFLRTALSPQAFVMVFRRRRSSTNCVSDGSPPVRTPVGRWHPQMSDAGLDA